jgi:transposase
LSPMRQASDLQRGPSEWPSTLLVQRLQPRYTVAQRSTSGDGVVKRQALELYREGLGFRFMGRTLGFSHVTILNWIRALGEQWEGIKNDSPVPVVEIDERHSYVGSKKRLLDRDGC